jgi:hypothetical protein
LSDLAGILVPEHRPPGFSHSSVTGPNIYQPLAPRRHRYRWQSSTLPNHIDDAPRTLSQLQLIESQVHGFRKPQTAPDQQSDQGRISSATEGAERNGMLRETEFDSSCA